jgi:hypothetical protein
MTFETAEDLLGRPDDWPGDLFEQFAAAVA